MATARLKCSNCGAEISHLDISPGKRQWIWLLPFLAFMIAMPLAMDRWMRDGSDFRADLSAMESARRYGNGTVEILGAVRNGGQARWQHVVVKAEFYGADGQYLDELSERIAGAIAPGATENFKITGKDFPRERWEAVRETKLRVADAFHPRY